MFFIGLAVALLVNTVAFKSSTESSNFLYNSLQLSGLIAQAQTENGGTPGYNEDWEQCPDASLWVTKCRYGESSCIVSDQIPCEEACEIYPENCN